MDGNTYRLTDSVLTIEQVESEHKPLTIPDGECVRVLGQIEGSRFVQVDWRGRTTNMFLSDLLERARPLEAAR